MRKYLLYIVILWCSCTLFSCTNDDYQVYNAEQVNKMYFDRDTFTFVYGPREDKECDLEIPISLIGLANLERDAEFKVSIDTRNSTAKLGVHFNMDEIQYFKKDSEKGTIKIDFIRSALIRDMQYKLYLHLEANDEYVPTNKTVCTVLFGDITLAQPKWWMPDRLGTYTQEKFVLFFKYFRETEDIVPALYSAIVNNWGEYLDDESYWRFPWLLTTYTYVGYFKQYVYTPMYEYFLETGDERYRLPNPLTTDYE